MSIRERGKGRETSNWNKSRRLFQTSYKFIIIFTAYPSQCLDFYLFHFSCHSFLWFFYFICTVQVFHSILGKLIWLSCIWIFFFLSVFCCTPVPSRPVFSCGTMLWLLGINTNETINYHQRCLYFDIDLINCCGDIILHIIPWVKLFKLYRDEISNMRANGN